MARTFNGTPDNINRVVEALANLKEIHPLPVDDVLFGLALSLCRLCQDQGMSEQDYIKFCASVVPQVRQMRGGA